MNPLIVVELIPNEGTPCRLTLPLSQNELNQKLTDSGLKHGNPSEYTLKHISSRYDSITWAGEHLQDILKLNYIAQMMAGFDDMQLHVYGEVIGSLNRKVTAEHLLGVAYGVQNDGVDCSIKSRFDLGRKYIQQQGYMDNYIQQRNVLETLGDSILLQDDGQLIPIGYLTSLSLFEKKHFQNLPAIDLDGHGVIEMKICASNDDIHEAILLPCERITLDRAVHRLGSDVDKYRIISFDSDRFIYINEIIGNGTFEEANELAQALQGIPASRINEFNNEMHYRHCDFDCDSLRTFTKEFCSAQYQADRDNRMTATETVRGLIMTAVGKAANLPEAVRKEAVTPYRAMLDDMVEFWNLDEHWPEQFDMEVGEVVPDWESQEPKSEISFS